MYLHLQSTPFPITFRGFNRLGYWTKKAGQGYTDGLLWCESCNHKLHEVYFELNDIEKTLFLILNTFTSHWRWELVKNVEQLWKQIHDLSLKSN
jgi:3-hydroxyanthranilate 3,4-dioxygenase